MNKRALEARHKALLFDETRPLSLGCTCCPELQTCGGLQLAADIFDCGAFCTCGSGVSCNAMCRGRTALFVARYREIGGFALTIIPKIPGVRPVPPLPLLVPLIFRGALRRKLLRTPTVAVPLSSLFYRNSGEPRFHDGRALRRAFKIAQSTTLVITGVDHDMALEKWWGSSDRSSMIGWLAQLQPAVVTTPNYSLFTDVPRYDNLHNMKRIALDWHMFAAGGIPAALHINGRTPRDYDRWLEFLQHHTEIDALAFEFATGAGSQARVHWHVKQLLRVAQGANRPLRLIVRGGRNVIRELGGGFIVTVIDSDAFMKTVLRQRATIDHRGSLAWSPFEVPQRAPLDSLLEHNLSYAAYSAATQFQRESALHVNEKAWEKRPLLELCASE